MTRYTWATDVHLDFIDDDARLIAFAESLIRDNPDGIIFSGDISVSNRLTYHLSVIERVVQRPIYFVLGNHDYYGDSIEKIRENMKELSNMSQYLRYLPLTPYTMLSSNTAVVGHDGWYDALNGDWQKSTFTMNDWGLIREFAQAASVVPYARIDGAQKATIVALARKLAHAGVMHVHDSIKAAARHFKNIVVVTHYPPFAESHVYNGRIGDAHAQPWFTSRMMGEMLLDASKAFPKCHFTVFAGHTHGQYDGKMASNLDVHVGGAEYGRPGPQQLITVP